MRVTVVLEALIAGLWESPGIPGKVPGLWDVKRHGGRGVKLEILSAGKKHFNHNVQAECERKGFFNFFHYYWTLQFLLIHIFPKMHYFIEIIKYFRMNLCTTTSYNLLKLPRCLFVYSFALSFLIVLPRILSIL